jgi:AraC family transcriptional regulator of adaptative response / DNA-3-methyladenine glycosylase II
MSDVAPDLVSAMPDAETCYRALRARDRRFDGVFFVAVSTTGIYCRPICPARLPGRDRVAFYRRGVEAERDGFRACLRCRPELAPGDAPVDSVPRLVTAAVAHIDEGFLNEGSVEDLARLVGVTDRHLRRALEEELGVTPVELAQSRRLALAKRLLQDSALPLAEIAFASGFASVRRFNALFQERFGRPPSALRRAAVSDTGTPSPKAKLETISLRLDYRPPLAWEELLGFLAMRAIPGVERADPATGSYRRTVRLGKVTGWIAVAPDRAGRRAGGAGRPALRAEVSLSLAGVLMPLVARLRGLFDLDARPAMVDAHLAADPLLRPLIARRPGLRVPGAFDAVEIAVRAVLGQQVTVRGATTLASRLVERFGAPIETPHGDLHRLFPGAETIAGARLDDIASLGMPGARARTVQAIAAAALDGRLPLATAVAAPDASLAAMTEIPGIGDWTASYLALRLLRWPDAFPAGDVALRKALGGLSPRAATERAAPWRPWRSYAVLHLWTSLSDGAKP